MRKVYLVGIASEEKRAVTALEDGNVVKGEEAIYRCFIDRILLLKLVDGEARRAASS